MNPEIEKLIISLIESARQTGSDVASFISEQAPGLATEIVRLNLIEGIVLLVFGTLFLSIPLFTYKFINKREENGISWNEDSKWIFFLITLVSGLIALMIFSFGIPKTIKSIAAPKIVVIEKVSQYLNNKTN